MNKFVKTLVLAAVTVVGTATFTSVEAISSDEGCTKRIGSCSRCNNCKCN